MKAETAGRRLAGVLLVTVIASLSFGSLVMAEARNGPPNEARIDSTEATPHCPLLALAETNPIR